MRVVLRVWLFLLPRRQGRTSAALFLDLRITPTHPHQVNHGVLYTSEEAEGKRLRNPFDTITEGIGINRLTANFKACLSMRRVHTRPYCIVGP